MACAVRGVDPVERAAASIEIHQASKEDYPIVERLGEESLESVHLSVTRDEQA